MKIDRFILADIQSFESRLWHREVTASLMSINDELHRYDRACQFVLL